MWICMSLLEREREREIVIDRDIEIKREKEQLCKILSGTSAHISIFSMSRLFFFSEAKLLYNSVLSFAHQITD